MALFPGPDSPAYRAWSAAADIVILNVLTLAGCLPVVTAGASLTACARVAGEMAADDDPAVVSAWWRSFRLNLRQSLAWWLPVLVLVVLSAWEYLLLSDSSLGERNGGMSGALSGLVLAGGALLAAILTWLRWPPSSKPRSAGTCPMRFVLRWGVLESQRSLWRSWLRRSSSSGGCRPRGPR